MTKVKICGLTNSDTLDIAISSGADYIGLVFVPSSPRYISIDDAKNLIALVPKKVTSVGLFVNPTDQEIHDTLNRVKLDMIQLHGHETPERLVAIKEKFALPIIKAIRIESELDTKVIKDYEQIADIILFDTKSKDPSQHGGTGESFDWAILIGNEPTCPWMLAGGLTPKNVKSAIEMLNPPIIDVSSGVESESGIKDPEEIKTFIEIVKNTSAR